MKLKRMTLELSPADAARFDTARKLSGLGSYADTARVALRVLCGLLREREGGARLVILGPGEGRETEVTLPAPPRPHWADDADGNSGLTAEREKP